MLTKLSSALAARGVTLRLAEARSTVGDILREEGLDARAGPTSCRNSVTDAIKGFHHMDAT